MALWLLSGDLSFWLAYFVVEHFSREWRIDRRDIQGHTIAGYVVSASDG
jgi:hypothetical protein